MVNKIEADHGMKSDFPKRFGNRFIDIYSGPTSLNWILDGIWRKGTLIDIQLGNFDRYSTYTLVGSYR